MPTEPRELGAFQESKSVLLSELNQKRLVEESMCRQKSRVLWLIKRGCNTFFFHRMTSSKRRVNAILIEIVGLDDDATMDEFNSRVTNAFATHFKSTRRIHVESWETQFPCLNPDEVSLFKEEEI